MASFLTFDRPVLTTMVQAKTPQRALELIRRGLAEGTDAFGLQLERLEQQYCTPAIYRELFDAMEGKPSYVTDYYFGYPAGERSDEACAESLLLAQECGGTMMDIPADLFCHVLNQITDDPTAVAKQTALAKEIHARGGEVLFSTHTSCFCERNEVLSIMEKQKARGADITKVVVSSDSDAQLNECIATSAYLRGSFAQKHLFLCAGTHCILHRRLSAQMGSSLFLCVVEHDELATAYQPLLSVAKELLRCSDFNHLP
jgi:hypothetical protein